jgi:hypothetical protein
VSSKHVYSVEKSPGGLRILQFRLQGANFKISPAPLCVLVLTNGLAIVMVAKFVLFKFLSVNHIQIQGLKMRPAKCIGRGCVLFASKSVVKTDVK